MFKPIRVLDTGVVEVELVDPIPLDHELACVEPLRFGEAVHRVMEIAVGLGIKTELQPAKVYGRRPDGLMELRRFVLHVPGGQELRRKNAERQKGIPFGGRGRKKKRRAA